MSGLWQIQTSPAKSGEVDASSSTSGLSATQLPIASDRHSTSFKLFIMLYIKCGVASVNQVNICFSTNATDPTNITPKTIVEIVML